MTVCLGALCADEAGEAGRAVVVASDRMVTFSGLTESEHEVPKVTVITDRIVALMAGDALQGSRIIREVGPNLPAGSPAVQGAAEALANRYASLRNEMVQGHIFTPRGITMHQFYDELQQKFVPQLSFNIDNQVIGANLGVQLLIAGVDDSGAHLFQIDHPGGTFSDYETIGFSAIGSGTLHALQSIIRFRPHAGSRAVRHSVPRLRVQEARRGRAGRGQGH